MFHVEHPHAAAIGAGRPTPDRWTTTRTGLQDCDSDRKRRRSRDPRCLATRMFHVEHPAPTRASRGRAPDARPLFKPTPTNAVEAATPNAWAAPCFTWNIRTPAAPGPGTGVPDADRWPTAPSGLR